MNNLNEIEKLILSVVSSEPQSIYEIHKQTTIGGWATVKHALNELLIRGVVSRSYITGLNRHKTLYKLN